MTSVKPKPAAKPYSASAVAAPSPDKKPCSLLNAIVLRMHRIPMGPTGAAIDNPKTILFHKAKSIYFQNPFAI